jgi:hypothetical protein
MTRLRNVDNSNQRVNDNKKAGYSFHGIWTPPHRVLYILQYEYNTYVLVCYESQRVDADLGHCFLIFSPCIKKG